MLYRQVNISFKEDFDLLSTSGLYNHLQSTGLLIPHEDINKNLTGSSDWYRTLKPQALPFISYPYEWCFDMLKDAALLTLQLAEEAINHGMMLKDASPFNIQALNGKLIFIDTLSFEKWDSGRPWIAYRQFCESFIAPLALMHYRQLPLQSLLLSYPDGLPLPYAKKLLPLKSKLNLHAYLHLHLHSSYAHATEKEPVKTSAYSVKKFKNLFQSLTSLVRSFLLH
jgi:hypothetical protein